MRSLISHQARSRVQSDSAEIKIFRRRHQCLSVTILDSSTAIRTVRRLLSFTDSESELKSMFYWERLMFLCLCITQVLCPGVAIK